jgi:hypothetical protein
MNDEEAKRMLAESIRQFQARRTYASFDLATLQAISDDEISMALFDYAITIVDHESGRPRQTFILLPERIQALYSTWMVDAEVRNGRFNQYFWNTSGELANDAVLLWRD